MDWLEEVNNQEERIEEIFSFDEYMRIFKENYKRELRSSAMFFKDMFDVYGLVIDYYNRIL